MLADIAFSLSPYGFSSAILSSASTTPVGSRFLPIPNQHVTPLYQGNDELTEIKILNLTAGVSGSAGLGETLYCNAYAWLWDCDQDSISLYVTKILFLLMNVWTERSPSFLRLRIAQTLNILLATNMHLSTRRNISVRWCDMFKRWREETSWMK